MYDLNKNLRLNIQCREIFICVFTLTYLDNMSQQQENVGFLTQKADFKCWFCFVSTIERANLKYDIINKNRYYHETMGIKKKWAQSL